MSDAWCDDCGVQGVPFQYVRVGKHSRRLCEECADLAALMAAPEGDGEEEEA